MKNYETIGCCFFKRFFLVLLISIYFSSCKQDDSFQLSGSIENIDSGISYLGISSGFIRKDFSDFRIEEDENQVKNGKFQIQGALDYPHAFRLMSNDGQISGLFFLDNNDQQSVIIDTLGINKILSITNSPTNNEYIDEYQPLIRDLNKQQKFFQNLWNDSISERQKDKIHQSIRDILSRKDEVLLNYIKGNPHSYVGMWILAENFSLYGYKPIYREAYSNLSDRLKNTRSGIILKEKLAVSSISDLKGNLPDATLVQYKEGKKKVSFKSLRAQYTLVDFWGSFCAPCIRAFPEIKKLYDSTQREFFDVMAISVDSEKNIPDWEKFIEKNPYPWQQFRDDKMVYSKRLMINAVPANFLIDSEGVILMKNFSPQELKDFLNDN